jgi:hypothetical protein
MKGGSLYLFLYRAKKKKASLILTNKFSLVISGFNNVTVIRVNDCNRDYYVWNNFVSPHFHFGTILE